MPHCAHAASVRSDRLLMAALGLAALASVRPAVAQCPRTDMVAGRVAGWHGRSLRAIQNLAAFTRLYGLVRFYHPSEGVRTANWNDVAVRGVLAVELCPTPETLARALADVFAPIAPTVRVTTAPRMAVVARIATAASDPASRTISRAWFEWRHRGLNDGDGRSGGGGIYTSRLVTVTPGRGKVPARPLVVSLGGGVSATVPVALPALAAVADTIGRPYAPRLAQEPQTNDRVSRIAAVATAWAILDHFYPHFDAGGPTRTSWHAELPEALRAAAAAPDTAGLTVLRRLIARVRDGHAYAFRRRGPDSPPERAPAMLLGWVEHRVVVTDVRDTALALRRGDVVLAVDGRPISQALAAAESLESGSTRRFVRQRALRYLLVGPEGSSVVLRVRSGTEAPRDVALLRRMPARAADQPRSIGGPLRTVAPGIVYADLTRVTEPMIGTFLPQLMAARGIILDLRGYPPFDPLELLRHFLHLPARTSRFEMPVLSQPADEGRRFEDVSFSVEPAGPRISAPVVFLAGPGSASSVETTLALAADDRLGLLVGDSTAGANGNINSIELPGGYGMQWTGMRVRRRNGARLQGVGVPADVVVRPTILGTMRGEDEVLTTAVKLLRRRLGTPVR